MVKIEKELVHYMMDKQINTVNFCRFCNKNQFYHENVHCPMLDRMVKAEKIFENTRMPSEKRCEEVQKVLGENPFNTKEHEIYGRVAQEVMGVCHCDEYEGILTAEEVKSLTGRKIMLILGEESHKDEVIERMKIEQNNGKNVFVQFIIPYEDENTIENNKSLILEYVYKMLICDECVFVGFKKDDDDPNGSNPTIPKYILNIVRNHKSC